MMGAPSLSSLLICAATEGELAAWPASTGAELLVSGVGIPETFASLARRLAAGPAPASIVNIGIAGAYADTGLAIGDIVVGGSDVYGDIGFELPAETGFHPISEATFGAAYRDARSYAVPEWLVRPGPGKSFAVHAGQRGCTVNCCTGTDATGILRARLFDAQFETMEGAAVVDAAASFEIPVCCVRAISNIAARRDMRPQNIRRALSSLAEYLDGCIRAVPSGTMGS